MASIAIAFLSDCHNSRRIADARGHDVQETRSMNKFGRPASLLALGISLCLLSGSQHLSADETVQPTPFGQMINRLNPANWKMPNFRSMLPQTEEKARIKKKRESLVDEVGKTASSSWTRTTEALNPARFFTTSAKTPATPNPTAKKPGFFQSLFAPAVPPDENATVSGFLKQSRPTP
jgi:hypothetical protein